MHTRENALHEWLNTVVTHPSYSLTSLAGDASFRRYYRLQSEGVSYVVMDAPPPAESIQPFLLVAKTLMKADLHVPIIFAVEPDQGFILLEDLGDQVFLKTLTTMNADKLYKLAMDAIHQLQRCSISTPPLPAFNQIHMQGELALFRDWFLGAYLGLELNQEECDLLDHTFTDLIAQLTNQQQVFIHRDYHSRNLMVLEHAHHIELGIIDFQDAMSGPCTYDLVSLLKDCYVQWPREQILTWLSYFYEKMPAPSRGTLSAFCRDFDLTGLQRHLKVLGIFCRLSLRDHKHVYLNDLPLTLHYVMDCLENYTELHAFYHFMQSKVQPLFMEKHA